MLTSPCWALTCAAMQGHLRDIVNRIAVFKPDILMVEGSVSRPAQQALLEHGISLALNVKHVLLERLARSTGAELITSLDNLFQPRLGTCTIFHVEHFTERIHSEQGLSGSHETEESTPATQKGPNEEPSAEQSSQVSETAEAIPALEQCKHLMFFDGCPKALGATVILRGAPESELKKAKDVLEFAIFAAYHEHLEVAFLMDEDAALPCPLTEGPGSSLGGSSRYPIGMEFTLVGEEPRNRNGITLCR
jgi:1-phosphatidylinositol-3-phosphate 5-kinase